MGKPVKKKTNKDLCRLITPEFRVSYPHLFKAQAPKDGDKKKFSVTMLIKKTSDMMGTSPDGQPRSIKRIIRNAKIAEFGPDKSDWPEGLQSPIVDGDSPKFRDKEGYKGCWVIKAATGEDQRPSVVDRDMNPITEPADFYPGCYARAYIYAYAWEYMGKQGIGFILDHVQKLRDGKSFGGKKPVEQVFSPVEGDDEGDEDEGDDGEADFK